MELAGRTGDPRVLPYFQYFSTHAIKGGDVQSDAEKEIKWFDLRAKGSFPA